MIGLSLRNNPRAEIDAIIARFAKLPNHIAKKHLGASMKRALKPGVTILRALTPPAGSSGRGRKKGGPKSSGKLRRAVTTKSKFISKGSAGVMTGVLGYKYGIESRKALWLNQGTTEIMPMRFMQKFIDQYAGPVTATLKSEMLAALKKAVKELASGKNPGRK